MGPHRENLMAYQRTTHDFFIPDHLREEMQRKSEASLQTFTSKSFVSCSTAPILTFQTLHFRNSSNTSILLWHWTPIHKRQLQLTGIQAGYTKPSRAKTVIRTHCGGSRASDSQMRTQYARYKRGNVSATVGLSLCMMPLRPELSEIVL